jgi:hypothetical protein
LELLRRGTDVSVFERGPRFSPDIHGAAKWGLQPLGHAFLVPRAKGWDAKAHLPGAQARILVGPVETQTKVCVDLKSNNPGRISNAIALGIAAGDLSSELSKPQIFGCPSSRF